MRIEVSLDAAKKKKTDRNKDRKTRKPRKNFVTNA